MNTETQQKLTEIAAAALLKRVAVLTEELDRVRIQRDEARALGDEIAAAGGAMAVGLANHRRTQFERAEAAERWAEFLAQRVDAFHGSGISAEARDAFQAGKAWSDD